LSGAARNSALAPSRCIAAPRAPLERALDPGRPRRGTRESRGRGVVASGKLQEPCLCIFMHKPDWRQNFWSQKAL
jgi:hypothetical protein